RSTSATSRPASSPIWCSSTPTRWPPSTTWPVRAWWCAVGVPFGPPSSWRRSTDEAARRGSRSATISELLAVEDALKLLLVAESRPAALREALGGVTGAGLDARLGMVAGRGGRGGGAAFGDRGLLRTDLRIQVTGTSETEEPQNGTYEN